MAQDLPRSSALLARLSLREMVYWLHQRCLHAQGEGQVLVAPTGLSKEVLSSRELHRWRQRRKMDLYGGAGISCHWGVWLTHHTDAQHALEGRERPKGGGNFAFKFFLSCRKIRIFVSSPETFYRSTLFI